MNDRHGTNLGKRERLARKRRRRGAMLSNGRWFKVGLKHLDREIRKSLSVADAGRSGNDAP